MTRFLSMLLVSLVFISALPAQVPQPPDPRENPAVDAEPDPTPDPKRSPASLDSHQGDRGAVGTATDDTPTTTRAAATSPNPVPATAVVTQPSPPIIVHVSADATETTSTDEQVRSERLAADLAIRLLPRPPRPDLGRALLLLMAVLASMGLANLAERPLVSLESRGLLPGILKTVILASRTGALLVAFVGLLHLVPAAWSPAVSYVLVGTALAVGWSVREVVQDVLVGLIFTLERSFRTGQRLRFEGAAGTLTRMTFRVTWLRTDEGADIAIPNRKLTGATLELDPQPYAPVSVLLLVPPCRSAVEARRVLRELVLMNPYLAPGGDPQVYRQADDPRRWRIKARLLDASYADRFRGTMVDLVEEVFGLAHAHCEDERDQPSTPA